MKRPMDKKVNIILFMIISFTLLACSPEKVTQNRTESAKIDSLVGIVEINDRTIIVKFGYDAVTAIKTSEGIVLVDAGISTFLTGKYKRIIEDKFRKKDFCYVINTHGHHDHMRGNSLFPGTQIAGHENCRMDLSGYEGREDSLLIKINKVANDYDLLLQNSPPDSPEWEENFTQKIRYRGAWLDIKNGIPFKLPDVTFTDSMVLECGDMKFEMKYFGVFHSTSDILIYVPELKVLSTGDLFTRYGRPGMNNSLISDYEKWINAVDWINQRMESISTIIDGHGQVLTINDLESFNENILGNYLKTPGY